MKEAYLTPDTLKDCIGSMLREVRDQVRERTQPFHPEKSGLLVIDMQDYFLNPDSPAFLPASQAILPVVQSMARTFALSARPVVFTRHVDSPASESSLWRFWRRRLVKDNELCRITKGLDTGAAKILDKSEYDAFFNTDLEEWLRSKGVTQLVVCGVMTNLCCETTARSAFVRGFDVFFAADATATVSREIHAATLLNLAHGFATVDYADKILTPMTPR